MARGNSLIAVLVVASKPRHKLLRARTPARRYFREEFLGGRTAQGGRERAPVKNLDFTGLARAKGKTQITVS